MVHVLMTSIEGRGSGTPYIYSYIKDMLYTELFYAVTLPCFLNFLLFCYPHAPTQPHPHLTHRTSIVCPWGQSECMHVLRSLISYNPRCATVLVCSSSTVYWIICGRPHLLLDK